MARIEDEPPHQRRTQAAVLAACILGHLALGLWLAREPHHAGDADDSALEIHFIPATPAQSPTVPVPAFPVAPSRPAPARTAQHPRPTPSAPPDRPVSRIATPEIPANLLRQPPSTARLLDAAEAAARAGLANAMPTPRDPTKRHAATVPGREQPFTPEAYVLRKEISPADVVNAVGSLLFGGRIDQCPDTRSKIRDLVARNDPRGEDELRVLIDRERRLCR
ncbi:hypothetical protein OS176_00180 [Xanthomonadaceae bacterium XH05]|nr:hypothetical protein [Xanthomonadaceae bacterium XH05]